MQISKSSQVGDVLANVGILPEAALTAKNADKGASFPFSTTLKIQGVATVKHGTNRAKGAFSAAEIESVARSIGLADKTASRLVNALREKAKRDAEERPAFITWQVRGDVTEE